jgi:hypothetical protein
MLRKTATCLLGLLLLLATAACDASKEEADVRAQDAPTVESTTTTTEAPTTTTAAPTTTAPTTTSTVPPTTVPPTTTTTRRATTTTTAKAVAPATSSCHSSYQGTCIPPDVSDADCAGGTGNGPWYVQEKNVRVVGPDVFGLDADHDGYGCEA